MTTEYIPDPVQQQLLPPIDDEVPAATQLAVPVHSRRHDRPAGDFNVRAQQVEYSWRSNNITPLWTRAWAFGEMQGNYPGGTGQIIFVAKIFETPPKILEMTPKILEVTPKILEVSPKILEVSPKTLEVSPKILEVSPKILEVSPKILEVSPKILEVPPKILEVTPKNFRVTSQNVELTTFYYPLLTSFVTFSCLFITVLCVCRGTSCGVAGVIFRRHIFLPPFL